MRGLVLLFVVIMTACGVAQGEDKCYVKPGDAKAPEGFETMTENCAKLMRAQVNKELTAALTYMAMGAHFSLDSVNRPGFAKMFFASASEEREHAFKIIDYLLMRGLLDDIEKEDNEKTGNKKVISKNLAPKEVTWASPLAALKDALKLEISVTTDITAIIKECEDSKAKDNEFKNDYHLVDYLTGDFLEEQLHGQRDLAGKIATLGKMMDSQGPLAEFLFDKKLLNGEPL